MAITFKATTKLEFVRLLIAKPEVEETKVQFATVIIKMTAEISP